MTKDERKIAECASQRSKAPTGIFMFFHKLNIFMDNRSQFLVVCLCRILLFTASKQTLLTSQICIHTGKRQEEKSRRNVKRWSYFSHKNKILYTFYLWKKKRKSWDPLRSTGCYCCCWEWSQFFFVGYLLICDCPYSNICAAAAS